MTDRQKQLVQDSFLKVTPIADQAAALFYERLFALDPSLRPMFQTGLEEQGKKLMQTLGVAVRGLNYIEDLIPVLEKLAQRHAGYGVLPGHYDTVGEALLWTLGRGLGEAFTPEMREAWVEVYAMVACIMKTTAYPRSRTASHG